MKWKLSLTLMYFFVLFLRYSGEKKRLLGASRFLFLEKINLVIVNKQIFLNWQKLKAGKRLRTQWNSCESTLLTTEGATHSYNQESAASTRGHRRMHVMDLANNRGLNLLLNFLLIVLVLVLAFILVKLMWTSVRLRCLTKPHKTLFWGFRNDNVDTSNYLNINMRRLHRLKYLTTQESAHVSISSKSDPKSYAQLSTCHWVKSI